MTDNLSKLFYIYIEKEDLTAKILDFIKYLLGKYREELKTRKQREAERKQLKAVKRKKLKSVTQQANIHAVENYSFERYDLFLNSLCLELKQNIFSIGMFQMLLLLPKHKQSDDLENDLIDSVHILTGISQYLDFSLDYANTLLDLFPYILNLVYDYYENNVLVELVSKCISSYCLTEYKDYFMEIVLSEIIPILEHDNDHVRLAGSIIMIELIKSLDVKILPYLILLLVPIMGRMCDYNFEVREKVTYSFGSLLKLLPLESTIPDPPKMSEELIQKKEKERSFLKQFLGGEVDAFDITIQVDATLRDYQCEGVNWLAFLYKYNLNGILCDDMGLGKTLQALCIMGSVYRNIGEYANPNLIVCPSTLVYHWKEEIKKFCDDSMKSLIYVGNAAHRASLRGTFHNYQFIIMSYSILRNDIEPLSRCIFEYATLDEGHIIKNPKTKLTVAIKKIKANHRLILSGTPIQNNVLELWSLFDFLMPGLLGTEQEFKKNYSKPITKMRHAGIGSIEEEHGKLAIEALHRQVLPFILRRKKEDVLHELPPKIIQDCFCDLSPLQILLYQGYSSHPSVNSSIEQKNVLGNLNFLRQLCTHPDHVITEDSSFYVPIQMFLEKTKTSSDDIIHGPKFIALRDLLYECNIGNSDVRVTGLKQRRVLIFCQYMSTMDLIENVLFKKHMPTVTWLRLDGSIEAETRFSICTQFNNDPDIDVLLLSTKAGGLGLNLTGADTVIFMEHDWNPMNDLQAMDRAHRIGAKKTVFVYRILTKGTLEEKIMSLQDFKLSIAEGVVNAENQSFVGLSPESVFDLFTLSNDSSFGTQIKNKSDKKSSMGEVMSKLEEMWDESQYNEFDLDEYMNTLSIN
eukprot:TRINITY_DN2491_c0_g1_i1.p1 TRINITY_DN2491_c0_g1~~TRINITY_DN2491_c0_g1_i1.p1  ORF type:complete len:933 (-),score=166.71 TRINITY_DN2491_c0_g1_i1:826-3399(-)